MKKIIFLFVSVIMLLSCSNEPLDPNRFKTGTFEIPAGKGYEKTTIVRKDSIQIETYQNKVDTLKIVWKNNFNYTLQMMHPKTAIDKDPIKIKITDVHKNSYNFEAVIGHSNFVQKGEIFKIN